MKTDTKDCLYTKKIILSIDTTQTVENYIEEVQNYFAAGLNQDLAEEATILIEIPNMSKLTLRVKKNKLVNTYVPELLYSSSVVLGSKNIEQITDVVTFVSDTFDTLTNMFKETI